MFWKEELTAFFLSLEYFTRIPKPSFIAYSDVSLQRGVRYFPIVGLVVGFFASIVGMLFYYFFGSPVVTILVTMAFAVLLTGGLHEDGLGDFFDGFGGRSSKEKILEIMKDSRIGSFGFLGLFFILMIKFQILNVVFGKTNDLVTFFITFTIGQIISRAFAALITADLEYVSVSRPKSNFMSVGEMFSNRFYTVFIIGVLALLLTHGIYLLPCLFMLFVFYFGFRHYLVKRIGGYTGDCLGAAQQVAEAIYYLSCLAIINQ